MWVCRECGVELVAGENWYKSCAKKRDCICGKCSVAKARKRKEADPEAAAKLNAYYKEYRNRPGNREKQAERSKKWKAKNKDAAQYSEKRKRLKYVYGITLEAYEALFATQGNACAICGVQELPEKGQFHLDHDHNTGEIRGILCNRCNHGLGHFRDSPVFLASAIEYLGG